MGMTVTEKILAKNSGKEKCVPGEIVEARVDVAMLHDIGTPGVQEPLRRLKAQKIPDSLEVVIIQDHFVPAPTVKAAENIKITKEYADRMKIKHYYGVGRGGICHQVMPEKGHVRPGEIIIGTDSHTTTYGAFAALGTGVGVTDMAITLSLGRLWLRVPESIKVELEGNLPPLVSAKDISLFLLSKFGEDGLLYKSLELEGKITHQLSLDSRMCICDMAVEAGVKFSLISVDDKTRKYLKGRTSKPFQEFFSDAEAHYENIFRFDLSSLEPLIAKPHSPANVESVKKVQGIKIDQAFLGSCTNGRLEDLQVAAKILAGKKVHPQARLIVVPASQEVYLQALEEGLIKIFIEAGGMVTAPSCGACVGGHSGLLAPGEVCISSSNRNFVGRMGSKEALIYLASPATVAASAVRGEVTDPREES